MANYTLLRRGDRLPTVGVLQKLLNRSGAALTLDGVFGPRTREAVIAFQKARGLQPNGTADEPTWSRLIGPDNLPIVDCIDVFDPLLYFREAQDIIKVGGQPILLGGMSRGVVQAADLIAASSRAVYLLRINGHGRSGLQGISVGTGSWVERRGKRRIRHSFGDQRSSIHFVNAPNVPSLGLQGIFGPYGSVELHGCHVAAGAVGRRFIATLAQGLGVPVSAGIDSQISTFRFDGPTFTAFQAFPRGETLRKWCESLPDFAPLSVP